jgi:hypothetical protein
MYRVGDFIRDAAENELRQGALFRHVSRGG